MQLDEGFYFGLGAFETLYVHEKKIIFLEEHLKRLRKTLLFLGVNQQLTSQELMDYVSKQDKHSFVLKVAISSENKLFSIRDNPYTKEMYETGFDIKLSDNRRNAYSPFVYHKTLNYGDNIMENRLAKKEGYQEVLFLNTEGLVSECSTANIFFVKNKQIYTPKIENGLLPGILREYVLKAYSVVEKDLSLSDIEHMEEAFVTNSVLGIMPVCRIGQTKFPSIKESQKMIERYFESIGY